MIKRTYWARSTATVIGLNFDIVPGPTVHMLCRFVAPNGTLPSRDAVAARAAAKAQEVEKLQSSHTGLFNHLLKAANIDRSAPAAGIGSNVGGDKPAVSNGNGASTATTSDTGLLASTAATFKAPPGIEARSYEEARQHFLKLHSAEYGYGGIIDSLYPKEAGLLATSLVSSSSVALGGNSK